MGRKSKYSNRKRHKSRVVVRLVKRHGAGTSCVNIEDYHFEIKEEVVETLRCYAQHNGNELCGVLTGVMVGENTCRICKASPPCVKSNSKYGCERDAELSNQFLKEDYELSDETRSYIGEWHTHPESKPSPSSVDCQSIENNYFTATHTAPFLVMIIVGTDSLFISVYNGKQIEEIEPKVV